MVKTSHMYIISPSHFSLDIPVIGQLTSQIPVIYRAGVDMYTLSNTE